MPRPGMLLRGALFGAPRSVREYYQRTLHPILLGGEEVKDNIIGTNQLKKSEITLLDTLVKKMQSVHVPTIAKVQKHPQVAKEYVSSILNISKEYIPYFDYFKDNLKTITANIETRQIVTKPDKEIPPREAENKSNHHTQNYRKALSEIVQNEPTPKVLSETELQELERKEQEALENFLNDQGPINKI